MKCLLFVLLLVASPALADKCSCECDCIPEVQEPTTIETSGVITEHGRYGGRGSDRPRWYFDKHFRDYPSEFVVFTECSGSVVSFKSPYWGTHGGFAVKERDDGKGMVILEASSCRGTEARIEY